MPVSYPNLDTLQTLNDQGKHTIVTWQDVQMNDVLRVEHWGRPCFLIVMDEGKYAAINRKPALTRLAVLYFENDGSNGWKLNVVADYPHVKLRKLGSWENGKISI